MQKVQKLVLVVDDNPTNLQVLLEVLDQQGWNVAVSKSGEEALEQLTELEPDIILLDVMMPGIDGFETCRRLKAAERTAKIPVIFMTALDNAVDRVQGLRLGAVDYITKPFQQEEVVLRLETQWRLQALTYNLEQQVAARTADLTKTLERLQQAQLQLIQHEKLAALGQLVAGVAHEINNPVTFIAGNVNHAEDYFARLLRLINLYQQAYPNTNPLIQKELQGLDLEFVKTDLPKLLASFKLGTQRIQDIVKSVRFFSRSNEQQMFAADLHAGLDSTLTILGSRLQARSDRPEIQIQRQYGDLPLVTCYIGELNQVFMNLLANAIDALEEGMGDEAQASATPIDLPTIQIQTALLEQDWVRIAIADNGPGIAEEIQGQLFEPFFTTKSPDKGTGLGLAISHQTVVEKYQGKLMCQSEPGQGTEFIIELPRQPVA